MALAVSQAVKIEAASGTTVTVNSAITFTAGALANAFASIFAGVGSDIAFSDSINGAYGVHTPRDNGNAGIRFGDKNNITGGLANLTVNGGVCNGLVGIWHEVTGENTSGSYDTENGTTGSSAAPDTVDVANAQANSIYFAGLATLDGANPINPYTINAAGSEGTWIEKSATQSRELNGASFPACGVVYQIVSSVLARSHTWTTLNTGWAAASVVYKAAAAGGARQSMPLFGIGAAILPLLPAWWRFNRMNKEKRAA